MKPAQPPGELVRVFGGNLTPSTSGIRRSPAPVIST
jgi:hypothetical protein